MVVAVRLLGLPARADDVDLRGDLVGRTEPGRRGQRDDVVGVVGDERLRRLHGQLLQRVPDPAVGARSREVVAVRTAGRLLLGDYLVEGGGHPVHHCVVGEGGLEDDHARPVGERADQLGGHVVAARLGRGRRAEPVGVVDEDVLLDPVGVGVRREVGGLLDDGREVLEADVGRGQPRGGGGGGQRAGHARTLAPHGPSRPTRVPQERLSATVAEVRGRPRPSLEAW